MAEIHVLPKDISELIAAGEVIDRPASVLKELTENAVDSGAARITAELKQGGILYLRVTDDGCGIAPEQVQTAFLRHATSKIQEKEDLASILTLGFRGEALASVCAVSRTEVLTRQQGSAFGTHYIIEGGEERVLEQSGCPEGTTIVVRDLFYNVPVRAGFLKKDSAEGNAAALVFQKIALSHPEISFHLIRENRTEFVTPGDGDLFSAIHAIFGRQLSSDLIPVQYAEEADGSGIGVTGYVIKPLYARANRSMQFFFINGRAVRSATCTAALEEAFKTLVMTGKFPACVLQIRISPRAVDVNMHPTKAEVRFSDEKRVYSAVYFAVISALTARHLIYDFQLTPTASPVNAVPQQAHTASPALAEQMVWGDAPPKPKVDWYAPVPERDSDTPAPLFPASKAVESTQIAAKSIPPPPVSTHTGGKPVETVENPVYADIPPVQTLPDHTAAAHTVSPGADSESTASQPAWALEAYPALRAQPKAVPKDDAPEESNASEQSAEQSTSQLTESPIRVIGELFENYILAEADEQLVMIDKHAAHERILFERFCSRQCKDRQALFKPTVLLLTTEESDALQEQARTLEQVGFTFDFSEHPIVKLTGVPMSCAELDLDVIVQELAEQCRLQCDAPDRHLLDDYFHTLACKAAIRGGDDTTLGELQALAEQVWQIDGVRHCPHGRPVLFLLSRYQIEKQFRRIV